MRQFLKGDEGMVGDMAQRLQGSPDLYAERAARPPRSTSSPATMASPCTTWSPTTASTTRPTARTTATAPTTTTAGTAAGRARPTTPRSTRCGTRQIKNALAMLLVSQGVPMILMGDEVGRTQQGNNNTYCQDNELSWFDWDAGRATTPNCSGSPGGDRVPRRPPGAALGHHPHRTGLGRQRLCRHQLARRAGLAAGLVGGRAGCSASCGAPPGGGPAASTTASTWR